MRRRSFSLFPVPLPVFTFSSFYQELRNLQKQVFVKPFPDPDSTPSEAADPTAALWNVKEDGAAKGEDLGAAFTPTIRKGAAQLFQVTPEAPIVEAQPLPPLPSNSGKKVGGIFD